jgi:hypothetical protein
LQELRKIRRLSKGEYALQVDNRAKVWAEVVREITLCFDLDRILILKDVLYVSIFKKNLISVAKLMDHDYSVSFHSGIIISRNRNFIYSGNIYGNLFHLNLISHQINNIEIELTSKKRKTMTNESYL